MFYVLFCRFIGSIPIAIEEANATLNKPYKIEYSVGLEHFQHDTIKSAEEMIQEADAAMYKDKKKMKGSGADSN